MIAGVVNSSRQPVVSLVVRGPNGAEQSIDGIVDTGYNGFITVRDSLVRALGLPFVCSGSATLADGSKEQFAIHETSVHWDGALGTVEADVLESVSMLGMALLEGHDLQIRVVVGGAVTIAPIP